MPFQRECGCLRGESCRECDPPRHLTPTPLVSPSTAVVLCGKCGQYPGTQVWTEGALAYVHGAYQMWCERCVLDAQIAHAERAADQLPVLRLARAALDVEP